MGETRTVYRILVGDLLQTSHLENREVDGMISFRRIFGTQVLRQRDGWNWLRVVSNDGF
jgi:hypothetical protein